MNKAGGVQFEALIDLLLLKISTAFLPIFFAKLVFFIVCCKSY